MRWSGTAHISVCFWSPLLEATSLLVFSPSKYQRIIGSQPEFIQPQQVTSQIMAGLALFWMWLLVVTLWLFDSWLWKPPVHGWNSWISMMICRKQMPSHRWFTHGWSWTTIHRWWMGMMVMHYPWSSIFWSIIHGYDLWMGIHFHALTIHCHK